MAFQPSRRRFLAFAGLALSGAANRPALAQVGAPAPKELIIDGKPVNLNEQTVQYVGSWHIVSQINVSHARLKDGIGVRGGGHRDGDRLTGGSAELTLEYFSGNGRYGGSLSLGTVGVTLGGRQTRILADDRELASLVVDQSAKQDLTGWFGEDLAGLASVKVLRVLMEVGGTEYTVFEAPLDGTAEALAAMKVVPDHNYHVRGIGRPPPGQSSSQPGPCYLTTACCGLVGLDDDCFELTALRAFRDRVMAPTERGRREIARYYEIAPLILAEMRRRGEERRLLGLYFTHILPAAVLARLGFTRPPWRLYAGMTRRLMARYLPERAGRA